MNLQGALNDWLDQVNESRSKNTYKTSLAASREFVRALGDMPLQEFTDDHYSIFLSWLKRFSPTTEKAYASIMYSFCEYLAAKKAHPLNIAALIYSRKHETRRVGKRLREIDIEDLAKFRTFVFDLEVPKDDLTIARAKAWITLAYESGLRAFEICGLRRSNLNIPKQYGTVIGKGDKQAKFYFTDKSIRAINDYLQMRAEKEPRRGTNIPAGNKPLFVSHSDRRFKNLSPINTDTIRADLNKLTALAFGESVGITPHMIRHFFIDDFLRRTGNPEWTRKIARHDSAATTQHYIHTDDEEIQKVYREKFSPDGTHVL